MRTGGAERAGDFRRGLRRDRREPRASSHPRNQDHDDEPHLVVSHGHDEEHVDDTEHLDDLDVDDDTEHFDDLDVDDDIDDHVDDDHPDDTAPDGRRPAHTTTSHCAASDGRPANPRPALPSVLLPGEPCALGSDPDCIDPDGDGQGTYLLGGAACIAALPSIPELCADLDGDGIAGYPDSG